MHAITIEPGRAASAVLEEVDEPPAAEGALRVRTLADRGWLERLITRRIPLERWREAYDGKPGEIKTILDWSL